MLADEVTKIRNIACAPEDMTGLSFYAIQIQSSYLKAQFNHNPNNFFMWIPSPNEV